MAKKLAKRSTAAVIGVRVAKDRTSMVRNRLRLPTRHMGATHIAFDLEASLSYIDSVYRDFLEYGGLGAAELEGARVLEVGPGDVFGVPLRFLGDGAAQVTTMDRFIAWRSEEQQQQIYGALLERMDESQRERAGRAWVGSDPIRFDPAMLRVIEGVGAEDAASALELESFDLIVSRAVLEHVNKIDEAFDAMDAVLRPGGRMLHKVDFEDHGLFTDGGHHPLTFLTIGDRLYGWMGDNSGLPNRRLIDYFRDKLAGLGYDPEVLITNLIGRDTELSPHPRSVADGDLAKVTPLIEQIRGRLLPRYRALDDADLAVSGIFIVARKPL